MVAKPMVFVVDDEAAVTQFVTKVLAHAGYEVRSYSKGADAVAVAAVKPPRVVLLDLMLGDESGLDVLRQLKAATPDLPVVMVSGQGTIGAAVEALRGGAYDFLEKPIAPERLVHAVERALERGKLARQVATLRGTVAEQYRMVGNSAALEQVRDLVSRVAETKVVVLVTGESGVGKELVARALHMQSPRAGEPFVALNCAAIPKELIESELFGHERGAFTGADASRRGKLEQADGGTFLLDEVGDMSMAAQAKLLRFLENSEIQRLGQNETRILDVRVVAATNKNLAEAMKAGEFREDLYHRLNVVRIDVPPLRMRPDDIEPLARHFLVQFCARHNRALEFDAGCGDVLRGHPWPGNVRELRNVVERAVVLSKTNPIAADELRYFLRTGLGTPATLPCGTTLAAVVERAEREAVEAAISLNKGNLAGAARALGVERASMYRLMKRLGIATKGEE
jgi:DNA-binding NtrC family response regulator